MFFRDLDSQAAQTVGCLDFFEVFGVIGPGDLQSAD